MRVSHLTDETAYQPGTMARSGAPCSAGSGRPLISQARIGSGPSATSSGSERANAWVPPTSGNGPESAPTSTTSQASASGSAWASTSASAAPAQRAWPTAPSAQGTPGGGGSSSLRRWPAHSSTAWRSWRGMRSRAWKCRTYGRATAPHTSTPRQPDMDG